MTSCITSSRSRRAAALRFLFACAVMCHAGNVVAQQEYGGEPSSDGGVVISDDATGPTARDLGHAACAGPDPCEGCASCDTSGPCEPYCNEPRCSGWFGADWLHWRLDGNRLPPLVTDGSANTPLANVARLDDPGTRILSGDETVNDDWRDGYRIYGGFWLDCCHKLGIGGDYFNSGGDDYNFAAEPDPTRVVGRPFFNTEIGQEDAELISVPNELDSTVEVKSNDEFQGAGLTLSNCLCRCCDPCCEGNTSQLTWLSGYRFYKYDSNLSITENLAVLPGTTTLLVPGTTFFVQDTFRTRNEFNGGEIGLQGYKKRCWWWLDGMAKVAMGEQRRTVTVDGQTFIDVPGGGTAAAAGGLLTSEVTNIGRYHDSDFVLIPEFRLGLGAMVTHSCSVRAGYDVIIWGDVARAASHLPPGLEVDPRNFPPVQAGGGPEPEFPGIRGSQLVAQGFDFSVTWQF